MQPVFMAHSKAALAGVGILPASSLSPALSTKEMMFEAAVRAYDDAGSYKELQLVSK